MRYLLIYLFFFSISGYCIAQYNNWVFDHDNIITFDNISFMPKHHRNKHKDVASYYSNISNSNNDILFYTNGILIRNKDNEIMDNGLGLYSWNGDMQNSIILPILDDTNKFYVFTIGNTDINRRTDSGLCYSIVDLSYNNGLGKVIIKNKQIIKDIHSEIAAVHHANGKDYWIVVYSKSKPILYSILLKRDGTILPPIENKVGIVKKDTVYYEQGWLRFSPSAKRLASIDGVRNGYIELFDFDDSTGIISNPIQFKFYKDAFRFSCEFSPNEKYLYVAEDPYFDKGGVTQFDISSRNSNDILQSRTQIYEGSAYGIQLAIDGSIYFNSNFFYVDNNHNLFYYMSKIAFPNRKGKLSDVILDAITLSGGGPILGITNIPGDYNKNLCSKESFDFFNMNSEDFTMLGTSDTLNNILRITSTEQYSTGAFWYKNKVNLLNGFVCDFKFRFSQGNNNNSLENSLPGADGIAFVIQNTSPEIIGKTGGGIGYDGIPNSIAFEFDTYKNSIHDSLSINDPNGNHFAIQSNKLNPNSASHSNDTRIFINERIPTIKSDSTIYYVKMIYNPGHLFVYLDTSRSYSSEPICVLNNFYIENYIDVSSDSNCYVGFTASTGKAVENHDIEEWYLCIKPRKMNTIVSVPKRSKLIDNKVLITPNPATDYIEINLAQWTPLSKWSTSVSEIKIYDVLGNVVLSTGTSFLRKQVSSEQRSLSHGSFNEIPVQVGNDIIDSDEGNVRLDISMLAPGVYFVRVGWQVLKFVKM